MEGVCECACAYYKLYIISLIYVAYILSACHSDPKGCTAILAFLAGRGKASAATAKQLRGRQSLRPALFIQVLSLRMCGQAQSVELPS